MSFAVGADAYGRFMGRFSEPLSVPFAQFTGVRRGQRALDVGCGPGVLTERLAELLGAGAVSAVDPSASFVAAARRRLPGVEVASATAEELPFPDDTFDAVLAQLVVHFMTEPVTGLREMARVASPGGVVAACVWDHAGGTGPLTTFWSAVKELDPGARDESQLAGARKGHLMELFRGAGLEDVEDTVLTVRVGFESLSVWWESFTFGVGPAGSYVAGLDDEHRDRLRGRCAELLPEGSFEVAASAWAARGRAAATTT
jgi:SAM-dependent methyltransferase